ncbi:MAG: hypothetical protein SGI73_11885 [Chloroflexota bacterium]|nr:hypothetical protein [Chloroflexota bacterium]
MKLPPDPDSVEKWSQLPQNKPSRQALPPVAGGLLLTRTLLIGLFVVAVVVIIVGLLSGRGIG